MAGHFPRIQRTVPVKAAAAPLPTPVMPVVADTDDTHDEDGRLVITAPLEPAERHIPTRCNPDGSWGTPPPTPPAFRPRPSMLSHLPPIPVAPRPAPLPKVSMNDAAKLRPPRISRPPSTVVKKQPLTPDDIPF